MPRPCSPSRCWGRFGVAAGSSGGGCRGVLSALEFLSVAEKSRVKALEEDWTYFSINDAVPFGIGRGLLFKGGGGTREGSRDTKIFLAIDEEFTMKGRWPAAVRGSFFHPNLIL